MRDQHDHRQPRVPLADGEPGEQEHLLGGPEEHQRRPRAPRRATAPAGWRRWPAPRAPPPGRGGPVVRAPWFAEARREERCPPWTTGYPNGVAVKLGPLGRYELRAVLFVIAMALVGIPFGLLLHQVTTDGPLTALDDSAARWLNERFHGEDGVITLLNVVSFMGKPIFLLFAIGIPGLWIFMHGGRKLGDLPRRHVHRWRHRRHDREGGGRSTASRGGGADRRGVRQELPVGTLDASGRLLRRAAPRRPPVAARTGAHARHLRRTSRSFLAIGFSRLSLGVHFISDVLGGYVLGAAWLAGSVAALRDLARGARQAPHPRHRGGRGARGGQAAGHRLTAATGTRGPRSRPCCASRRGTGSRPWRPSGSRRRTGG